jgi:cyclopropane-fatty-acyl-phospholipid synthase
MNRLLDKWFAYIFQKLFPHGTLTVSLGPSDGPQRSFTVGDGTGRPFAIAFDSSWVLLGVLVDPDLRAGEAYTDGTFRVTQGTLAEFMDFFGQQHGHQLNLTWLAFFMDCCRYVARRVMQFNPRSRARKNVHRHYDLDGRIYSLFLDADKQYSCAYFEDDEQSLDDAQLAKKRHLAAKLLMDRQGLKVLDIGSGWGGLAIYLAEVAGAKHVTGVTLSDEQLAVSRNRVAEQGLKGRVEFRMQDYRDIDEQFDRIVSVGMFEHVGVNHYRKFFRQTHALLKEDGVAVLHFIGRSDGPSTTCAWIRKYIFPGGYIPALSEVMPAIEHSGLVVTDIEILRLHYAETLKAWRERFLARREEAAALYDERFCRMWEFYLVCSEMAFRHHGLMVLHIQLARHQEAVPLTRDYIGAAETRLRALERNRKPKLRLAGE